MKIIKIISDRLMPLFDKYKSFAVKDFDYNASDDNTCYIIEISPDLENAVSYKGVETALKIYFNLIQNTFNNFKIILCGFENELTFYRDCEYSMFLKCPGVVYHQIGLNSEINTDISQFDLEQAVENLKNIKMQPPSSYKTHHSMANEWALIRYFSMLEEDVENEGYNKLSEKIKQLNYTKTLYFQYQEALNKRQGKIRKKDKYTPDIKNINGLEIAIIDDEVEKGYGEFYTYLLQKSKASIPIMFSFKKEESKEEMMERLQHWIDEQDIDIFIVDLRLHDSDFYEKDASKLSGIQIIDFIKILV